MGIIGWIVFGFFAGLLARALFPGDQPMGLLKTTALGVGGSFVGGTIASVLWGCGFELQPAGFVGAVLGSMGLLALTRMMARRRS